MIIFTIEKKSLPILVFHFSLPNLVFHLLVAAYTGVFRTSSNIYNEAFFAKILNGFKLLTTFARKAPSQMFE